MTNTIAFADLIFARSNLLDHPDEKGSRIRKLPVWANVLRRVHGFVTRDAARVAAPRPPVLLFGHV